MKKTFLFFYGANRSANRRSYSAVAPSIDDLIESVINISFTAAMVVLASRADVRLIVYRIMEHHCQLLLLYCNR